MRMSSCRRSKTGWRAKNFNSYDRMAIVTDATSVRRTIKAFGWLIPGEVRLFHLDGLETARTWITG
jgi:hypothetical protein